MAWKRNNFGNSANNNEDNTNAACAYSYMDVKELSEQVEKAQRDVELAQSFLHKCQNEYQQAFTEYMSHCQQEIKRKGIPLERRSAEFINEKETEQSTTGNTSP